MDGINELRLLQCSSSHSSRCDSLGSSPIGGSDSSGGSLGLNQPPHVPCSYGAVGLPPFTETVHLRGPGNVLKAVQHLNALADAEVANRENIRAVKGEYHEHVNRPSANAFDHGEHREEGLVIHGDNRGIGEDAGVVFPSEVMKIGSLASGHTDLA